jgi:CHAD domain-containing protein
MGYRLHRDKAFESEVPRLAAKQLELAASKLEEAPAHWDDAVVHAARRHIKKSRALARLARKALGDQFAPTNRRLRGIARTLAPLTDGEAIIATLQDVKATEGNALPRPMYRALRATLLRRKRRVIQRARDERLLQSAARQLRREAAVIRQWELPSIDARTVTAGIRRSYRRARTAMADATAHPTVSAFHGYRRRVKDLWLQVRLLQRRCHDRLADLQKHLEQLDGILGAFHDSVVLQHVIRTESPDSRRESAQLLRQIRAYQRALRQQATDVAGLIFTAPPRQFAADIAQLLRADSDEEPATLELQQWARSA